MSFLPCILFSLATLVNGVIDPPASDDCARWHEMLYDHEHARMQSQAALLLVQARNADAESMVRQGLRQTDSCDVFIALAAAIRLSRDNRFIEELLGALWQERPAVREAAADTLSVLADQSILSRLERLAESSRADIAARHAAIGALGRTGCKAAAAVLVNLLADTDEPIKKAAAAALTELSGQEYGCDTAAWQTWWEGHKEVSTEYWLEERLAYQIIRARRLQGDLGRARSQVVQLHQILYFRLPPADRLGYVENLADHEDPAIRAQAVSWSVELMSGADTVGQHSLADLVLRLCHDGDAGVQRAAAQALGRVTDPRAFDRLKRLVRHGPPTVRAAAAHSLAQQAMTRSHSGPDGDTNDVDPERLRQVVPLLQQALDDPALEVVVAAAEDLGGLGVPEAGPVLAALLRHPSESVRLTAAQALERVADPKVLEGLIAALEDLAVPVRFSLVGALGRVAVEGQLSEPQRSQVIGRLEELVLRDADAGVRSRAAAVLGQVGPPAELPFLWRRVLSREDSRVQEKAWAGMLDVLMHAASIELVRQWDRTLADANQGPRRLALLTELADRWQKGEGTRPLMVPATELLVQAQLEQGRWPLALPLIRDLLTRPGSDADLDRRLKFLLSAGERALAEGNHGEAQRAARDAQPYLARSVNLRADFERLEKRARPE